MPTPPLRSGFLWFLAATVVLGIAYGFHDYVKIDAEVRAFKNEAIVLSTQYNRGQTLALIKVDGHYGECWATLPRTPRLKEGDSFVFSGTLKPGRGAAVAYADIDSMHQVRPGTPGIGQRIREGYRMLASEHLSPPAAAATCAMILGDQSGDLTQLKSHFRNTGTLHHLALSGMHVGFILFPLFLILRALHLSPKAQVLVCLPLLGLYLVATGPIPPLVRAVISFGMGALALGLERRVRPFNSLCLAAILCLMWDPHQSHSAGFYMTFAALSGLIFIGPILAVGPTTPWLAPWKALAYGTGAWLAIAPVLLWVFGEIFPSSIVVNILLIIPMTCVMMLGLLLPLAPWLAGCLDTLWSTIDALLLWSQGHLPHPWAPTEATWAAFFLLLVILTGRLTHLMKGRNRAVSGALALSLAAALIGSWHAPAPRLTSSQRLTQLAVGQGSSYLIEIEPGVAALVDCGGASLQVGSRVLAPALRERGIRRLKLVVLSHLDLDHRAGLDDLLARFEVETIALHAFGANPKALAEVRALAQTHGVAVEDWHKGHTTAWGTLSLRTLHPPVGFKASENDLTLMMHLQGPRRSALLTGDIEEKGLRTFLSHMTMSGSLLNVDVITAPHHGSRNRHARELLELTRPAEVWLSARPSFPKEPVWLEFPGLRKSWQGEWELGL
ncbi:MAG: ComEC/Rec2 family competence protein [Planctomycetota bacterium]